MAGVDKFSHPFLFQLSLTASKSIPFCPFDVSYISGIDTVSGKCSDSLIIIVVFIDRLLKNSGIGSHAGR